MRKAPSSARKAASPEKPSRRSKPAVPRSKTPPSPGTSLAGPRPVLARDPKPPRVVLAIGLPGSGKSTWFRRRRIAPLSSDHLRILLADDVNEQSYQSEIFRVLRYLLRVRLDLGRPVTYIDATNLVREQRAPFLRLARRRRCVLEALYFDVPLKVCLDRNRARRRQVPEDVMRRMAKALEPPAFQEGFRRIVTIGPSGRITADATLKARRPRSRQPSRRND